MASSTLPPRSAAAYDGANADLEKAIANVTRAIASATERDDVGDLVDERRSMSIELRPCVKRRRRHRARVQAGPADGDTPGWKLRQEARGRAEGEGTGTRIA